MSADSAPVADHILRCWHRGNGIRETIVAIQRCHGVRVGFEQVRTRFTAFADRLA